MIAYCLNSPHLCPTCLWPCSSSRGIITFLPSAPAEGVGVTGSILGAVGRAAAKVHGADAVASKVSPSLALAAVRQSLQGWMDDEAKVGGLVG
jgi:hypothetical protein